MKSERLFMRADPEFFRKIDDWRRQQERIPSRSDAIRQLVERGLASGGERPAGSLLDMIRDACRDPERGRDDDVTEDDDVEGVAHDVARGLIRSVIDDFADSVDPRAQRLCHFLAPLAQFEALNRSVQKEYLAGRYAPRAREFLLKHGYEAA